MALADDGQKKREIGENLFLQFYDCSGLQAAILLTLVRVLSASASASASRDSFRESACGISAIFLPAEKARSP